MSIPTPALLVRAAVAEDATAIETARLAAWRSAYADLLPAAFLAGLSVAASAPRQARRIAEPTEHQATLVAQAAGEVIGFAALGPSRDLPHSEFGELYAIYVAPDRQGIGAGSALHDAALAGLRAHGFTAATLRVLAGNAPARAFYERRGWWFDVVVEPYEPTPGVSAAEVRYRRVL